MISLHDKISICLSIIDILLACLIIYLAWKKSPPKMTFFKPIFIKVAVTDILLSTSGGFFALPKVNSAKRALFCNGLAENQGFYVYVLTGIMIGTSLVIICVSTFELALLRCLKIYNFAWIFQLKNRSYWLIEIAINGFVVLGGLILGFYLLHTGVMIFVENDPTPGYGDSYFQLGKLSEDFTSLFAAVLMSVIIIITIGQPLFIYFLSFLSECQVRKVAGDKRYANFTILLIIQGTLPILFYDIPGGLFVSSIYFGYDIAEFATYLVSTSLLIYQMANSILTILLIKPYRQFVWKTLLRISSRSKNARICKL